MADTVDGDCAIDCKSSRCLLGMFRFVIVYTPNEQPLLVDVHLDSDCAERTQPHTTTPAAWLVFGKLLFKAYWPI